MSYNVDTGQIRQHATLVGGVAGNLRAMSDAGAPDSSAYGDLLSALGLPGLLADTVGTGWDAITTSATGAQEVENGLRLMSTQYDADDDMAAFRLMPTVPQASPVPSGGAGGGGGASVGPAYAAAEGDRSLLAGAGVLDSGSSFISAVCDGSWVDRALTGVSLAIDVAATVADPIGSLLAAGIGWAIDHLQPIKGWFDDVTGSPEAVVAKGHSWGNIADGLGPVADAWQDSLDQIAWMSGTAIGSYRQQANTRIRAVRELEGVAQSAKEAMTITAGIVSFVHGFLRDILASLAGAIISWVAETVLSLGTLIPWVVSQISTRIASVVGRCSRFITGLTRSATELGALLRGLRSFGTRVLHLLDRITPNPSLHPGRHAGPPSPTPAPGPWRPPAGWTPPQPRHRAPGPRVDLPWRDSAINNANQGVRDGEDAYADE